MGFGVRTGESPDYYLALESLTSNEAWFIVQAASYSAVGEQMAGDQQPALRTELDRPGRVDGDLLNGWRVIELRALPDLSLGTYPEIAKQRYWEVTLFRMRPGSGPAFTAAVKAYAAAAQRAGRAIGWRLYEVTAGMPAPICVAFTSVSSFGGVRHAAQSDRSHRQGDPGSRRACVHQVQRGAHQHRSRSGCA